jgi:hypothetical protein
MTIAKTTIVLGYLVVSSFIAWLLSGSNCHPGFGDCVDTGNLFSRLSAGGELSKSRLLPRQRHVCSTYLSAHAHVLCRIVEWLDFGWLDQATNKRSIPRSYETGLLFEIRDNQFWSRGWRADCNLILYCHCNILCFFLFDDMLHLLISHVFTGRCSLVGWIGRLPTVCETIEIQHSGID